MSHRPAGLFLTVNSTTATHDLSGAPTAFDPNQTRQTPPPVITEMRVQTIHDDIMRWLYYLYLRAPGSTVILVANKCDGSIEKFVETAERVQQRVRELLKEWHQARGLRGRSQGRVTDLTLLPGISLVSCHEERSLEASGLPALIALISRQAATSIVVPPAWALALEVIDALRTSCDPTTAAREILGLPDTRPTGGVGDVHDFAFISKDELSRKWQRVVENVRGDAQAAAVSNWETALKGALWIRCEVASV